VWGETSVEGAVEAMRRKIRCWGHPVTLGELGIGRDQYPAVVNNVLASGMNGALRKLGKRDLEEILALAG
jgi:hypothetical protein